MSVAAAASEQPPPPDAARSAKAETRRQHDFEAQSTTARARRPERRAPLNASECRVRKSALPAASEGHNAAM